MENIIKYLQLYFTKGLGHKTIKSLIDIFGNIENLYNSSFEEISNRFSPKIAELVLEESLKYKKLAEKQLFLAEKFKVSILCYEDKNYPENLKNIPDPPPVLFIKGKLPNNYSISIVGTRKPTYYGKKITELITKNLVKSDICIVSGGAYGIDSIAHKTALKENGKTVAVLGSSFDFLYPPSHKKLFDEISENGAVISEFPFGTKASKYTFPQRNRIVAGLSEATVVIEAPEKSGSLITARFANDYGKTVFAVPSNIDNKNGKGCNILIKDGATPIIDENTILEEIGYLTSFEKDIQLNDIEKDILNLIQTQIHIDELSEKIDIKLDELTVLLFEMEMKGLIKNENGLVTKLTL
ncbi:DNA-processing protein DprA [Hydrogenothermus marinus]|uniref:DNA processing protein n=1 Tax=Hydrogenothermus marinus TaxID=133270 RepID=A0A3M0BKR7_9AQUI|nr:DNA-processing protein DprA [Hydrogenothermus marinus]RMA97960.1 DNA processing protein [Hydrogenothermus marinus]